MHIDLNSCYAIIEQQSNRLLRGRPVGVAAYDTPRGFVLAASYEAKAKGVKLGVNVAEARQLCPGIVIMTPDPSKYRETHRRFKELLLEYTPDVVPKSIDEFVLDFTNTPILRQKLKTFKTLPKIPVTPYLPENKGSTLVQGRVQGGVEVVMEGIGREIKQRVRERIGEAVTVNIGIAPNRFLAKFAAGFDKPDGMRRIDHTNLKATYKGMDLIDLPGIGPRYKRRLQSYGIHTPLDFLQAERRVLEKVVFRGITGYYWYLRLRGYEIDKYESKRTRIGHQYALSRKTADRTELARLLLKLCEKTGRRLRKNGLAARGIHLYLGFVNDQERMKVAASFEYMHTFRSWHQGKKLDYRLYTTADIYRAAKDLLERAELTGEVKLMAVTTQYLEPIDPEQLSLLQYECDLSANRHVSDAVDEINNRYGEFVITPGAMMDMQGEILDRVAFGSVRDV